MLLSTLEQQPHQSNSLSNVGPMQFKSVATRDQEWTHRSETGVSNLDTMSPDCEQISQMYIGLLETVAFLIRNDVS